jgi:hypothetical protein
MKQLKVLTQKMSNTKGMSQREMTQTIKTLNETAQELRKACQGIQNFAELIT